MPTVRQITLLAVPIFVLACGNNTGNALSAGSGGAMAGAVGSGGAAPDVPAASGRTSGDSGTPSVPHPLAIAPPELATRLAKFLWGAAPDAALVQRAAGVKNREEVGPLALEMLTDQRARVGVGAFYRWWLGLDYVASAMPDPKNYPDVPAAAFADAARSTETFAVDVTLNGDGSFRTLMTASFAYANDRLAALYGIAGGLGADLHKVDLGPKERAGILTQVAMLMDSDFGGYVSDTDPPLRGERIRDRFYCYPLAPLAGIPALPAAAPQDSNRQFFEDLTSGHSTQLPAAIRTSCPGCHYGHELNMLGLVFEGFDGVGRRRTTDRRGHPIDVSGLKIRNDAGGEVTFNGPQELAAVLTDISVVQRCVGQKWLTFAMQQSLPGRGDAVPTDDEQLDGVQAAFKGSGLDIRALIAAVVQTQAFLASAGAHPDGGADVGAADASRDVGPLPEGCATAPAILVACRGCHDAQAAPAFGGLDMATPGWERKLVGAPPPAGAPGTNACNKSLNYLNRTQPATGLFLDKLKASPPCGAQMPLAAVAPPLSASELACVQKWANNVVAGGAGQ